MRRLITLISAGRNRTIVIRRELPRTKDASSGAKPYRIERRRFSFTVIVIRRELPRTKDASFL